MFGFEDELQTEIDVLKAKNANLMLQIKTLKKNAEHERIKAKIEVLEEESERLHKQSKQISFMADGSSSVIKDRLNYKNEGVKIAIENIRQSISQLKTLQNDRT